MGAIVVLLAAASVVLLAAAAVGIWWLVTVVRRLAATLEDVQGRLQPALDELRDGAETAAVEAETVRAGIERLRSGRDGR